MSTIKRPILPRERFPYLGVGLFYTLIALFVVWRNTPVDYPVYLISAYGFLHNEKVYAWDGEDFARIAAILHTQRYTAPYLYPPLIALCLIPVLFIPYPAGLFVWTMLNGLAVITAGNLLAGLTENPLRQWLIRISVWVFVPCFTSLYAGQVNPLVTWLAVVSFLAFRRKRDGLGGSLLAVSLLLRPLAVGLAGYTLWRARWKALAALIATIVAVLAIAALIFETNTLGFANLVTVWAGGPYPPAPNLPSLAARWLMVHPYGFSLADCPNIAPWVGSMLAMLLAMATLVPCWPPGGRSAWSDVQLGLILVAILLVNART